jgi:hypothetical protein
MAQIWRIYGPNVANIWPKYGEYMAQYGEYMAQIWRIYGPNMFKVDINVDFCSSRSVFKFVAILTAADFLTWCGVTKSLHDAA